MAELDFTALNRLAYKGFETVEEQKQKDALIEQGFTIVTDDKDNPFITALEPLSAPIASATDKTSTTMKQALKSDYRPFTGIDARRDYRAMYRAACDFHERHNPPYLDDEMEYWTRAVEDMSELAKRYNNDPFLTGLLVAIYEELEREYKAFRGDAQSAS